uniref:Integrase catalytic domain-containing protein n=1 Tax=Fagus sylvatica TaxID=28930 RepID=A0A2N9HS85_FAGSY
MNLVLDDELQALLLLSSLPDSWETLVVSLSNSTPNGVLQLAMVKDSLFNEETRRKDMAKDDAQALVTENRGRSKGRNSKGSGKSRSQSQTKGKVKCFYCDKEGEDEYCHVADPYDEWVIDSAASYHVTPRREFFTSYKVGNVGRVKMGNKSYADIVGIGDICVETNTGYTLKLKDVRHIPDMHLNLISISVLDKEGYESHLGNGKWKLFKGSLVFARGKICCTLYKTQVKLCRDVVNATQDDSTPDLWHRRLAHMSEKGLQILAKKSLIPFAKDLVYFDVCGPIEVESLGDNRYFVTFIDDASRKVWVYVLKTKDQVFQLFKKFHAMVEREKGKSLKCLRTDNGGEYTSNEFENYCSEYGIRHEKTVLDTPQHHSVVERINRTIVEKVRCMLRMAKLAKSFLAEAVQTACYLINRSPSVPLDFDIPERVWTGEDASYAHLKVFGCKTFAHVPKEQRLKLDDKATPCIFVGYGDAEFGYKLWDPKKKKMIRSRDVVFHENENIKDFEKSEKSKSTVEGISDLTPTSSSSNIAIYIEEVQVENYGDEPAGVDGDEAIDIEGVEQGEQPIPSEMEEPQVRRSTRERHPSTRYSTSEYVLITDEGEPKSFQEVQSHKDKQSWMKAMHEEMNSLHKNNTYDLDLELEQMDVKTAFLHGDLEEEIYMAPRQWYKKFDSFMVGQGYTRTDADHCVYVKQFPNGKFIILLLYVDDMLIVGQDANMVGSLKNELFKSFDMKDLGPARQILGMQILRDRKAKKLWLSQEKYVERVLERFNMKHAKPVSTSLGVGSLMYAMVCTRPDIAHAVDYAPRDLTGAMSTGYETPRGLLASLQRSEDPLMAWVAISLGNTTPRGLTCCRSTGNKTPSRPAAMSLRFMVNPGKEHWEEVKWIFRYLRGSPKSCLSFGSSKLVLEGYTDANMAGDLDVTEARKEMFWMKRFLQDLGLKQDEYVVHCDSQSALDLSKNSTYHSRTKHIAVRYHWLRLIVDQQLMQLRKIHTDKNPADMLTKVVPKEKLELCVGSAGMNSN